MYVTDGEPYRPDVILWLELPEAYIVGTALVHPSEPATRFADALREAMHRPLIGVPRRPDRIRVAEPALAEMARRARRELEHPGGADAGARRPGAGHGWRAHGRGGRVIVANEGPSDEPNARIDDTLPAALINATWTCQASGGAACPVPNGSGSIHAIGVQLPAGSQLLFVVTGKVRSSFTGTLSNTAAVTPSVTDPVVANNSSTDDTEVFLPEIAFAPPAPAPALGVVGSCVAVLILLLVAAVTLRRAGLVQN
jgi:hypothetical protein